MNVVNIHIADNTKIIPSTMVLDTGKDLSIICLTYRTAKWSFTNIHGDARKLAFDNGEREGPNKFFLKSVHKKNTALYECEGTEEDGEIFLARMQLIVIPEQGKVLEISISILVNLYIWNFVRDQSYIFILLSFL